MLLRSRKGKTSLRKPTLAYDVVLQKLRLYHRLRNTIITIPASGVRPKPEAYTDDNKNTERRFTRRNVASGLHDIRKRRLLKGSSRKKRRKLSPSEWLEFLKMLADLDVALKTFSQTVTAVTSEFSSAAAGESMVPESATTSPGGRRQLLMNLVNELNLQANGFQKFIILLNKQKVALSSWRDSTIPYEIVEDILETMHKVQTMAKTLDRIPRMENPTPLTKNLLGFLELHQRLSAAQGFKSGSRRKKSPAERADIVDDLLKRSKKTDKFFETLTFQVEELPYLVEDLTS